MTLEDVMSKNWECKRGSRGGGKEILNGAW